MKSICAKSVLSTLSVLACSAPQSRALYSGKKTRNFGVSEETRNNAMWRQFFATQVGDFVMISRLGKSRVYCITAVYTQRGRLGETRILAEAVEDRSIFASFSWRDYAAIGVEGIRMATPREVVEAEWHTPKLPNKPAPAKTASKPRAKAAVKAVVKARKTRAKAAAKAAPAKPASKPRAKGTAKVVSSARSAIRRAAGV